MRNGPSIRLIFVLTALIVAGGILYAVVRAPGMGTDLTGEWLMSRIAGKKISPSPDQSLTLKEDGTFLFPSFQAEGKYEISGAVLTLHTDKYNGKTKQEFQSEMQAKYPGDTSMQKIASKVFEDMKFTVKPDHSELAIDFGGVSQVYRRKVGK